MTRSIEEVQEIVADLGYVLLDEYSDESHRKRVIFQDKDGYRYCSDFHSLMSGKTPKFDDMNNPFTLQNISLWIEKENKPFVLCENSIYFKSEDKLFFKCLNEDCREIFDINWVNIYNGQKCPFCSGHRVGKRNNLANLRPDLAKEWDYEKNEKNPEEYTEFANEEISWICSKCKHHWKAYISNRSNGGTGCPNCSDLQKESTIANELKKYFKENYNAISEYKILKNPDTNRWLPYDIYIPYGENPELNGFYIEVHWEHHYKVCFWHKKKANKNGTTPEKEFEYQKHKDKLKKKFANKNGFYIEIDLRKENDLENSIRKIESYLEEYG